MHDAINLRGPPPGAIGRRTFWRGVRLAQTLRCARRRRSPSGSIVRYARRIASRLMGTKNPRDYVIGNDVEVDDVEPSIAGHDRRGGFWRVRPRSNVPWKWLKASEAAEYANARGYPQVTVEMIRANVRLDLLPAYAVGTGFFYRLRVDDVDEWLEKRPWERSVTYFMVNGRWIAELDSSE